MKQLRKLLHGWPDPRPTGMPSGTELLKALKSSGARKIRIVDLANLFGWDEDALPLTGRFLASCDVFVVSLSWKTQYHYYGMQKLCQLFAGVIHGHVDNRSTGTGFTLTV
jgi:hypothetical protein